MNRVMVVGMHRSGTSSVARALHESGVVYMGKHFIPPAKDNPQEFYEDRDFVAMNKKILKSAGGSWRMVPMHDHIMAAAKRLEAEMFDVIKAAHVNAMQAGADAWGFKDPRTCLTWQAWQDIVSFNQVIRVSRDNDAVADSLMWRNGMDPIEAYNLIDIYNARLNGLQ